MIRKLPLTLIGTLLFSATVFSQHKTPLLTLIDTALNNAIRQYKYLATQVPQGVMPKTYYPVKKLETSSTSWWTSGFYPGSLLYLYEYSKDPAVKEEALQRLALLEKEQYNKGTHDLGFMMYCSYGNANRLLHDKKYEEIMVNSARSLSTRFNATVGSIRSWDSKAWKWPVIIDNMMNLELLFWATRHTGDSSFYKIAVTHANTTIKNHYRKDYSSWHVIDYDVNTGNVLAKKTAQGFADSSAWARGQSWGLYGFTVMYRETKDKKYLAQAMHIADFLLGHPNLPADKIPYWDYNSVDIPATYRDVSAACVEASALIELSRYAGARGAAYLSAAEKILGVLATRTYTAAPQQIGGFILKHSVGNIPGNSEIDVPLTYADYYYIEAMMRYKALKAKK
ncbi:glycoside hydrolase family 88 protein [Sediminibacterium soli]|uniref:glycoside hydrolase family 88 protein n=1 Tax=Sediminibacterium soli TaxID=2698829 RepID=UPI00137A864B|nr:glycoside hydrolase family 88 protein [Sediminibacterium soli]NCI46843.1 glucuronyl hydrolase [Sediminibacterium soli]